MTEESASLILELLRQMRAELATKSDVASLRSEVRVVKSDMDARRSPPIFGDPQGFER
jgi:hypothetical protein